MSNYELKIFKEKKFFVLQKNPGPEFRQIDESGLSIIQKFHPLDLGFRGEKSNSTEHHVFFKIQGMVFFHKIQ